MAATASTAASGRTRSLRVPASSSLKPVSQLQLHKESASPVHSPSHIALFLTNLRLLDLDLKDDWPAITEVTFSTKDSQANLKRRVQCVEWALYQFFSLWDPDEAHYKLQPFFPPLEPLQSLNLRAALFRSLEQAKKSGVLGRDAVLRKTMLDECKGERFEEVLAVFSTAVLKKILQESGTEAYRPVAQRLSMEKFSYTGERTTLTALVLAHKVSLKKTLRDKNEARARYEDFADLMRLKERQLTRRAEQLKEAQESEPDSVEIAPREVDAILDRVRKNWSGDNRWLETVTDGDSGLKKDALLSKPYPEIWKRIEEGTVNEIEGSNQKPLLEQLDYRVKQQRSRLEKWKAFRNSLSNSSSATDNGQPEAKASSRGIDLGFGAHTSLQIGRSTSKAGDEHVIETLGEYTTLLDNVKEDLANIGKPQVNQLFAETTGALERVPIRNRMPVEVPAMDEEDQWSDIVSEKPTRSSTASPAVAIKVATDGQWEDDISERQSRVQSSSSSRPPEVEDEPAQSEASHPGTGRKKRPSLNGHRRISSGINSSGASSSFEGTMAGHDAKNLADESRAYQDTPSRTSPPLSPGKTPTQPSFDQSSIRTPAPQEPPQTERSRSPTPDPTDDLAEQILNSVNAASPSPQKPRHVLSLAERTRLSMARTPHLSEPDDLPSLRPSKLNSASSTSQSTPSDPHADLIERTRISMAGFAAAQKKAQLDRRRSLKEAKKRPVRESTYFPKVDEEGDGVEDGTKHHEEVLAQVGEEDFEAIFKSRPRVQNSPGLSPEAMWEDAEQAELEDVAE